MKPFSAQTKLSMFWRYGFDTPSPLDTLLDAQPDIEALLDMDEILQEVKAMNTRIVEL